MSRKLKFKDYKGVPTVAPPDLRTVLLNHDDKRIVLSRSVRTYRVRYGLEARDFSLSKSIDALEHYAHCLHHYLECEGLLGVN